MASLAATNVDLMGSVALTLFGSNDLTDATRKSEMQGYVNAGYRNCLKDHTWSFLRPTTTMTLWPDVVVAASATVAASALVVTCTGATPFYSSMVGRTLTITGIGTRTITGYTSSTVVTVDSTFTGSHTFSIASGGYFTLVDGFERFEDDPTYADGTRWPELTQQTPEYIRQQRSLSGQSTADPVMYGLEAAAYSVTAGQRWELTVWPTPATARVIEFRCRISPSALSADGDIPIGGPCMSDAYLYAALAASEMGKAASVFQDKYQKIYLPEAVRLDMQRTGERNLGENRDDSNAVPRRRVLYQGTWSHES